MEIRFQAQGPGKWHGGALLLPVCEGEDFLEKNQWLDEVCPWLAVSPGRRDFRGRENEACMCYGHPDLPVPRVLLLGLGKRDGADAHRMRALMALAARRLRSLGVKSALLPENALAQLPGGGERLAEEAVYGAILGLYRFTALKKNPEPDEDGGADDDAADPDWLALCFSGDSVPDGPKLAARRGENAALAVCRCRDLANMPGNLLGPAELADKAVEMAAEAGFTASVLREDELGREGLGCMLGVGRGSDRGAALIVLEYAPKGHEQEKPIILVGKGITFDSGGISLKPAANMGEMKCDMSGAAAVLCAIWAAAAEGLQRRVVGLMPCAENMPGGRATRPGDVLVAAGGQSVEVVNTDAEGRLVLCDALCYAQKYWTPAAVVDIATLTGACAVALGSGLAGLFCRDDAMREKIMASGNVGGERYWHLPLYEPYMKELKSDVADIKNSAGREGGAITAALFLAHFMRKGELWAHLDIAGVDFRRKGDELCPAGATGFGCRTLLEFLRGGLA